MIPALARGLEVLKLVLLSEYPLGFGEIKSRTRIPPSSVMRLLKSLEEGGYIVKDAESGKYRAGNELLLLGRSTPAFSRLLAHSRDILARLQATTRNTAILIYWNGREMQCLDKVVDPYAVAMQEVGTIRRDLSRDPWGWIFYQRLDAAGKREAQKHMEHRKNFFANERAHNRFYEQHGYMYDDQQIDRYVRRITAPVVENGSVVGAVAVGGTILTLPDSAVARCAAFVQKAASELSIRAYEKNRETIRMTRTTIGAVRSRGGV